MSVEAGRRTENGDGDEMASRPSRGGEAFLLPGLPNSEDEAAAASVSIALKRAEKRSLSLRGWQDFDSEINRFCNCTQNPHKAIYVMGHRIMGQSTF